jgi:hypothetical protein
VPVLCKWQKAAESDAKPDILRCARRCGQFSVEIGALAQELAPSPNYNKIALPVCNCIESGPIIWFA